jgi:hypothetical protein
MRVPLAERAPFTNTHPVNRDVAYSPTFGRRARMTAAEALRRVERWARREGGEASPLSDFARARFSSARDVARGHEALLFLAAYPHDEAGHRVALALLERFERRADLQRFRHSLADSGIAGTEIHFPFFWFTARWIARRWPGRLGVDWPAFEKKDDLEPLLALLLPYSESLALDELTGPAEEWIHRLKRRDDTDGAFLVRRFAALAGDSFVRELVYERLDLPLVLAPGPDTPSRTKDRIHVRSIATRPRGLDRRRPDLAAEWRQPLRSVRACPPREAEKLVDLARGAMVTRSRDLNVFEHADARDVRLADAGDGLQFACLGVAPERRLLLESAYGFLTLQNGIPIGYVLLSGLFGSSEVAFNVFETFRGGEAGRVFGRVIALARHWFGSDAYTIGADQLGEDNEEGLRSGAWWFYYKMGFRPEAAGVKRVLAGELRALRRHPSHRSGLRTLVQLSSENLFWYARRPRADVLGRVSLGNIGLAVSRRLAERYGGDRERGVRESAREAAHLLGAHPARGLERVAWARWGPLVMALPGVETWPQADRGALAAIVRAKWSGRESEFVKRFDRHRRLRAALLRLSRARA